MSPASSSGSLPPALISRLATLTSLDEETLRTQIIPYLLSLKANESTLRHHLADVIGPGKEQGVFGDDFVAYVRCGLDQDEGENEAGGRQQKEKEKKVMGSATTPTAAKAVPTKQQQNPQKHQAQQSPAPTATPTPPRASTSTSTPTPSTASAPTFTLAPSDEMKLLEEELSRLTTSTTSSSSTPSSTSLQLTCYCQGRHHALFSHIPLCTTCGLLLCSLNTPHPYTSTPPTLCPSCCTPLLTSSDRHALVTSLQAKKVDAESRALARAESVRLQREQAREMTTTTTKNAQEAMLFPELSGGDAVARQRALEVDYAMGRKTRPVGMSHGSSSGTGTSTAMIHGGNYASNEKARVLTIGKKGKVYVGNGPQKKKNKKDVSAKVKGEPEDDQPASLGTGTTQEQQASADSTDVPQEDADPPTVDLDAEAERLGMVIDYDDDGRQSNNNTQQRNTPHMRMPFQIRYIPPGQRTQYDQEDQETHGQTVKTKAQGKARGDAQL